MQEKLNQLSLGEKLVIGGAAVILVASVLFDWAQMKVTIPLFGSIGDGQNGWGDPGSIWSILAIVIAVALGGLILARQFANLALPGLPAGVSWGMAYAAGAALVVLFMLLKAWRITAMPEVPDCDEEFVQCSVGFATGYWVAAVGALLIAAGAYLLYTEDKGVGFSGLRQQA